jgi:hypothetical protein
MLVDKEVPLPNSFNAVAIRISQFAYTVSKSFEPLTLVSITLVLMKVTNIVPSRAPHFLAFSISNAIYQLSLVVCFSG